MNKDDPKNTAELFAAIVAEAQNTTDPIDMTVDELSQNFDETMNQVKTVLSSLADGDGSQPGIAALAQNALAFLQNAAFADLNHLAAATYFDGIAMRTDLLFSAWRDSVGDIGQPEPFNYICAQHLRLVNLGWLEESCSREGTQTADDIAAGRDRFLSTAYAQALLSLEPMKGSYPQQTIDRYGKDLLPVKRRAVILFFTLHPDMDPADTSILTADHLAEIQKIYTALDDFLSGQENPGGEQEAGFFFMRNRLFSTQDSAPQSVPRVTAKKTKEAVYPIDKVSLTIWNNMESEALYDMIIGTEKTGSQREANILVSLNFDELETFFPAIKRLTAYDKRVYSAVASLYRAGNRVVSATQIYHALGFGGRPSAAALKRLNDSLTKMGMIRLFLDNTQETEVNKGYPVFKYDSQLLPFARISAYINGKFCDSAINMLSTPPLIEFAENRRQIVSLPPEVFSVPLNHTDSELLLENYFLDAVPQIKRRRRNKKILFDTLCSACEAEGKKDRHTTRKKAETILSHYKKVGFISGFQVAPDGYVIEV